MSSVVVNDLFDQLLTENQSLRRTVDTQQKVIQVLLDIKRQYGTSRDSDRLAQLDQQLGAHLDSLNVTESDQTPPPEAVQVTCPECQRILPDHKTFLRHRRNTHRKQLVCPESDCKFRTISRQSLTYHRNAHSFSFPYECTEVTCAKSLKSFNVLI